MGQENIGVNLVKSSNESLDHLLLVLEQMDHCVSLLLQLLLDIVREWAVV